MWNHLPINKLLPQCLMTKKEIPTIKRFKWILILKDLNPFLQTSSGMIWFKTCPLHFIQGELPKTKWSIDQNCCLPTVCFGQLVIWFLVILDEMMLAFKSYFSVTQPHTKCSVCNKIKFWDQKCILWINNKWEMEQSQFIVANFYLLFSCVISRKQKYTHRKMSQLQND